MENLTQKLKDARKEVRAIERMMFSGKKEEAWDKLILISEVVTEAQKSDPNSIELKMLAPAFNKLKRDLERKIGKELPKVELKSTPIPEVKKNEQNMDILKQKLKDGLKEVRAIERMMFSGKKEEAWDKLEIISEVVTEAQNSDPNLTELKMLVPLFNRLKKDLERRLGKELPKVEIKSKPVPEVKTTINKPISNREQAKIIIDDIKNLKNIINNGFKGGDWEDLDENIAKIENLVTELKKVDRSNPLSNTIPREIKIWKTDLENGITTMAYSSINSVLSSLKSGDLDWGKKAWEDFQVQYKGHYRGGLPILTEVTALIDKLEMEKKGEEENRLKIEQLREKCVKFSDHWRDKIGRYLSPSQESELYLPMVSTDSFKNFMGKDITLKMYEEMVEEINNIDFTPYILDQYPEGKTEMFDIAKKDLFDKVENYKNGFNQTVKNFFEKMDKKYKENIQLFETQPYFTMKGDDYSWYQNEIDSALTVLGEDERVLKIKENFEHLKKLNMEKKETLIDKVRMEENQYVGDDKDSLVQIALNCLNVENPLKVSVIRDWKEEQGWIYTDTTKTATKYKISKNIQVQIVIKDTDMDGKLYTIYLESEKNSDNSWSTPKAHLQFTDKIRLKNI